MNSIEPLFCYVCCKVDEDVKTFFTNIVEIMKHYMTNHGTLDLFACHFCSRAYTTKEELVAHNCADYKAYRMNKKQLDPQYQTTMKISKAFWFCVDCGERFLIRVHLGASEAHEQLMSLHNFCKMHPPSHVLLGIVHSEENLLRNPIICMKTSLHANLHISCPECGIESFESGETRDEHFSLVHELESTMQCPQEGCDFKHIDEMKMKKHVLQNHIYNGLIGFFMNNYGAIKVRNIGLVRPKAVARNKIQKRDVLIGGIACWDEDTHVPIEKDGRSGIQSNPRFYKQFDEEMLKIVGRPDLVTKFDFKHQDKNLKMCTKIFNDDGTVEDFDDMQIMDCYSTEEDFVANEKLLSSCSIEVPFDFESQCPERLSMTKYQVEYCKKCNVLLNGIQVVWNHHDVCKDDANYLDLFPRIYFKCFNRMLHCPFCGDCLCSINGWLIHMYIKHGNLVKYEIDGEERQGTWERTERNEVENRTAVVENIAFENDTETVHLLEVAQKEKEETRINQFDQPACTTTTVTSSMMMDYGPNTSPRSRAIEWANGNTNRQDNSNMVICYAFGNSQHNSSVCDLNCPSGFCISETDNIIIANSNNHSIVATGPLFPWKTGKPGYDDGQLYFPRKVIALKEKSARYVVLDVERNGKTRAQIFIGRGEFVKKINLSALVPRGEIEVAAAAATPNGQLLLVDTAGLVYSLDVDTPRFTFWFDASDHLGEPSDVSMFENNIYITDFQNHCVQVFNSQGRLLRKMGELSQTPCPNGIDIIGNGEVLVAHTHGNYFHVVVFNSEGHYQHSFKNNKFEISNCVGIRVAKSGHIVTLCKQNHTVFVFKPLVLPNGVPVPSTSGQIT